MILGVYSIRDIKTGFLTPTFELNDAVALRNFKFAMNKTDSIIGANPVDFELFKIADFDTTSGEFFNIERISIADE